MYSYLFYPLSQFNTEGVDWIFQDCKTKCFKSDADDFWALSIVKTTSKKSEALIYSMKFISSEAAVYLYAARLSVLFILNLWFVVEIWLGLWNMICVLSMSKVLLQTSQICSTSSFLQTSFLLLVEFEIFGYIFSTCSLVPWVKKSFKSVFFSSFPFFLPW